MGDTRPPTVTLSGPAVCADCGAQLVAGNRGRWYGRKFYGADCHFGKLGTFHKPHRSRPRGGW